MTRKMTRNTYKRRIIVIGVMVFTCIALISTGFAAWVISTNATKNVEGNISVGKVTDSSITIENVKLNGLDTANFYFEPLETDTTGRVRGQAGGNHESLSVVVTGEVHNAQYLNELKIFLDLTAAPGIKAAADANYINLPDCAKSEVVVTLTTLDETTKSFSYEIKFEWGSVFNNDNPGIYFDKYYENPAYVDETTTPDVPEHLENTGATVANNKVAEILASFRKTMYNGDDTFDATADQADMKFTVVIIATVN